MVLNGSKFDSCVYTLYDYMMSSLENVPDTLLFYFFRQESHFFQQPQCFQTRIILWSDIGTSKMSYPASLFYCISFWSVCVCGFTSDNNCLFQRDNVEGVSQPPSDDVIRELSRSLRQALGVSLFGIDVIINNQTGQHAVIDINAFPGKWSIVFIVCIVGFLSTNWGR